MPLVVKVPVTESERGWGQKIDDYVVCLSNEDGLAFTKEFNSKNDKTEVPDWYMVVKDAPMPLDISEKQFEALNKSKTKRLWLSDLKLIK